ncbi:hypothetical protein pb186bvf_016005 [Paramecium bursaria]
MEDHQLVIQLLEKQNAKKKLSEVDLKSTFSKIRNGNLGFQDAFVIIIQSLLRRKPKKPEYLVLLKELFQSFIDLQMTEQADQVLRILLKSFPDSNRIKRLRGVLLELNDDNENALIVYDKMLQESQMDSGTRKRKIALIRKEHNTDKAITLLNKYLQNFPQDLEAWLELADIFLESLEYQKAQYCMEEVLLLQSQESTKDTHYVTRIAELNYASANYAAAKNYYCFVLSKNGQDVRCLWGLFQTLRKKKREGNDKDLAEVIVQTLKKIYSKTNSLDNYPFQKILAEF